MEKVLVDLSVELETFALIDPAEFQEAAQVLASSRRIELRWPNSSPMPHSARCRGAGRSWTRMPSSLPEQNRD